MSILDGDIVTRHYYTLIRAFRVLEGGKIYIYPVVGYKITYFVATLSYDNYYINLRDYSNSLMSVLL